MVFTRTRIRIGAAALVVGALALTGCSAGPSDNQSSGKVTITVGDQPKPSQPQQRQLFLDTVKAFEKANPNITIKPSETTYNAQTFNALLAGGTLPTVMQVPYSDIQGLISKNQLKNVSQYYDSDSTLKKLNPSATSIVKGKDGDQFGVPTTAFTLGLMINRSVFTNAGLDPDTTPLSTWADVEKAAAIISSETDAAGFGMLSTNNQGGWILTAMTNAFGGEMQKTDSSGKTAATVDNAGAKASLNWLHDLRWKDNAAGSNFLMQFSDLAPKFASGQYGMILGASQWYQPLTTTYSMPSSDFGLFPIPQAPNGKGALGGGSVNIIPVKTSDAEAAAAVKWSAFRYLEQYTDLDLAKQQAAASAKDGNPVPAVGLSLVSQEAHENYLSAVAPWINVPQSNLKAYNDASTKLTVLAEPPVAAQQLYAALDPIIQAVLTQEDADVNALLSQAQANVAAVVASAAN